MTTQTRFVLPLLLAIGILSALPATASAYILTVPADAGFTVVGKFTNPSTGQIYTGVCFNTGSGYQMLQILFGANGLFESTTIQLNSADNVVVFGGSYFAPSKCAGYNVTPLVTNGYSLTVSGGAGNDIMWGPLTTSNIVLVGQGGNDELWLFASGIASGGDGDDIIHGYPGTSEWLLGGPGSDCIDDADRGAQAYDCGSGTDRFAASDATFNRVSCEQSTPSCN